MKYIIADIWEWNLKDSKLEFVENIKKGDFDKAIFFAHNEWNHWSPFTDTTWEEINNALIKHDKILHVTTASKKLFIRDLSFSNIKIYNWTTHWFNKVYEGLYGFGIVNKEPKIDIDMLEYTKPYISLNHRPHSHRCILIDMLEKHNLVDKGFVTWHFDNIDYFPFKYFKQRKLFLSDNYHVNRDQYTLPIEYNQAFAQLISESTVDAMIISEKTATALITGKPFLVATIAGFHAYLQELGFELYTEIFDYSFDNIESEVERYESLIQNFKKLCDIPVDELKNLNDLVRDKVKYNQALAEKIALDESLYPDVALEVIELYRTTGEKLHIGLCHSSYNIEIIKQRKSVPKLIDTD